LLGHVFFSLPLVERRPESLVSHQKYPPATTLPMGHDILYLPPRATPRVNHQLFGLVIFLR
jgi:hypothetical protein